MEVPGTPGIVSSEQATLRGTYNCGYNAAAVHGRVRQLGALNRDEMKGTGEVQPWPNLEGGSPQ